MKRNEIRPITEDYPIDVVITWVDGDDPEWKQEKLKFERSLTGDALPSQSDSSDDCDERYRDWDMLKYLFRGIEKFMPWVRTIHFVTCGQIPVWMNVNHPQLNLVNHRDYMPADYLPSYNSNAIEVNFHRIPGLSEHFIYFNDDMLITDKLSREDFFIGGYPVDMLALQPVVANPSNEVMSHIYLNNTLVIARHFKKLENMKAHPHNYFNRSYPLKYYVYNHLEKVFPLYSGFYTVHGPSPLCKSTFEELWDKEFDVMDSTSRHHLRSGDDISQYLLREWKKQKNEFISANVDKLLGYYNISNNYMPIVKAITSQKHKMVCLNDANEPVEFDKIKSEIISAFEQIFPNKSSFEVL